MDIFLLLIIIPIVLIGVLGFSYILGGSFRNWNEGWTTGNDKSTKSILKTLAIGIFIFAILGTILTNC